jgi:hypothetical protein
MHVVDLFGQVIYIIMQVMIGRVYLLTQKKFQSHFLSLAGDIHAWRENGRKSEKAGDSRQVDT